MMTKETWKLIPNYHPYEASSLGRVRNPLRNNAKPLSSFIMPNGYHHLVLGGRKNLKGTYVHRLVCLAFNGQCPEKHECCHLNGNKNDNRPENLIWGTKKTNMSHSKKHGTIARGERQGTSKLSEVQVKWILASYSGKRGEITRMAEKFGVRQPAISRILLGQRWSHLHDKIN